MTEQRLIGNYFNIHRIFLTATKAGREKKRGMIKIVERVKMARIIKPRTFVIRAIRQLAESVGIFYSDCHVARLHQPCWKHCGQAGSRNDKIKNLELVHIHYSRLVEFFKIKNFCQNCCRGSTKEPPME